MAPRNQFTSGRAGPLNDNSDTITVTTQEDLDAANAEIERLRALLTARDTPASREETPNPQRLADVLEALSQRLARAETPSGSSKSAKIPDPPLLTDGNEPTFESWKLQLRGKLRVNSDHFPSDEARMAYVFGRTGGDAQKHLRPRYDEDSDDPYLSDKEMIDHLASIYEDPFKVQNARFDYKSLMMKPTETFAEFYTRFLHLSGQGRIPQEDLQPDLYDKLTLELQRAVLPVYITVKTVKELADQCLSLDQGLRRIKARTDRLKAKNPQTQGATSRPSKPTEHSTTPTPTRTTSPMTTRPMYSSPRKQALSDQGACFTCSQKGHFSKDCPAKEKGRDETLIIQETDTESGKETP
jgi:hypothetical protein